MYWLSGKMFLVIIICLVALQFTVPLTASSIGLCIVIGLCSLVMYLEFKNGG